VAEFDPRFREFSPPKGTYRSAAWLLPGSIIGENCALFEIFLRKSTQVFQHSSGGERCCSRQPYRPRREQEETPSTEGQEEQ